MTGIRVGIPYSNLATMKKLSALEDDQLLELLRLDNADAFTQIYNRYWEQLLAIGYYHTKDKQQAEDVVHDVMTSLWVRRDMIRIHTLQAYLATAVRFAVFKIMVRHKKVSPLTPELYKKETDSLEEKLDALFLKEYMENQVEQLPEKTRIIFNYRRDEITVSEISREMDLSPKAVEYHITKAIKALRQSIGKIKSFFV